MEGEPLVFGMLVACEYAPEKDKESVLWSQTVLGQVLPMPLLAV